MTTSPQRGFAALPPNPDETLELVVGCGRDYHALAEHHYRAARPSTMTRVLALRDHRPSVVGRYLQRRNESQTVGVLVESLPSLNCRLRDWALHERFGSWLRPRQRSRLMSQELRCISRVVVDPRWRGVGLAIRLVRHALDTATTRYTEALAAMGRVHPFFERAGMTAYHRPPHAFDARLVDALASLGHTAQDLAAPKRIHATLKAHPKATRRWFHQELHRWYRRNGGGRSQAHSTDPDTHLQLARQRLLLEPIYYLYESTPSQRSRDGNSKDTAGPSPRPSEQQQRNAGADARKACPTHRAHQPVSSDPRAADSHG